jgi:hypothetical protein
MLIFTAEFLNPSMQLTVKIQEAVFALMTVLVCVGGKFDRAYFPSYRLHDSQFSQFLIMKYQFLLFPRHYLSTSLRKHSVLLLAEHLGSGFRPIGIADSLKFGLLGYEPVYRYAL